MTRYGAISATLMPMQLQGFFRAGFCYSLSAGRTTGLTEIRPWAGISGNCFAQLSDLGAIKAWPTAMYRFPPVTTGSCHQEASFALKFFMPPKAGYRSRDLRRQIQIFPEF